VLYRSPGCLAELPALFLWDGSDAEWARKFHETFRGVRDRDAGPGRMDDAREILHEMRLVKDEEEIRFLRPAAPHAPAPTSWRCSRRWTAIAMPTARAAWHIRRSWAPAPTASSSTGTRTIAGSKRATSC